VAKTQGDHTVKGILTADGNAKFNKGLDSPYLEVIDEKARGIDGGTFTGHDPGVASWRTRDLTTVLFNDFATAVVSGSADLLAGGTAVKGDGGKITLTAGVYYVEISCPAENVDAHVARLADVTDDPGAQGSTVVLGTSEFAADSNIWRESGGSLEFDVHSSSVTRSQVYGKFQLTSSRTLEIQHRCRTTQADTGFGGDGDFYEAPNIYTTLRMWQVRDDS
jgi:hypothetical protein